MNTCIPQVTPLSISSEIPAGFPPKNSFEKTHQNHFFGISKELTQKFLIRFFGKFFRDAFEIKPRIYPKMS